LKLSEVAQNKAALSGLVFWQKADFFGLPNNSGTVIIVVAIKL
jgi:hypothetical protein